MTRWHGLTCNVLGVVLVLAVAACTGETPASNPSPGTCSGTGSNDQDCTDPLKPCTDPLKCCPADKMVCTGEPDTGIVCSCSDLWDCSLDPNKCSQEAPTPPGGGDWGCTWNEFVYRCTKTGSESDAPDGGSDWNCTWQASEGSWTCTKNGHPPNPTNNPIGAARWTCLLQGSQLVCSKKGSGPPPPTPGPITGWTCTDPTTGQPCAPGSGADCTCQQEQTGGGLPPGGANWKCNKVNLGGKLTWVCYGEVPPGGSPPGGGGWDCIEVGPQDGQVLWKCVKPDDASDHPPGGGFFSCMKGSEFNGTRCEKVDQPPTPIPLPGQTCVPGQKMWCDGLQYCGWGQVTCAQNGSWPTTTINGKTVIDCQELGDGKRPNTTCACYHYFFNPACCERPDCLVPAGSQGQTCPKSAGKLCDYCNPQLNDCAEAGAYCLVTNTMETFCGKGCTVDGDCPKDYRCLALANKPNKQCIPSDFSCYY